MRTLLALLLTFAVTGCGPTEEAPAGSDARPVGGAAPGEAPQIVSVTADALRDEIREMDAEAVVLNVWATWCGPCRVEFPEFVRYGREMADENVAVRFLSVDEPQDLQRVQQFLTSNGAEGRTYLTAEGTDIVADLATPYRWTYGIPVTIIFGPDGAVRDYWEGAVNYDFLHAKVKGVLQGGAGAATG